MSSSPTHSVGFARLAREYDRLRPLYRAVFERAVSSLVIHHLDRSFSRNFGLERLRGRYGLTFDLLAPEEYEAGLARAESELPDPVSYVDGWLLVVGSRR